MPARSVSHPSADSLRAFGLGRMDTTSAGVLMAHLDQCEDCCKVVASLSGDDFLKRLRQARDSNAMPASAKTRADASRPPQPPPGPTTLFNVPPELADHPDYEVLRELGHGGMGVVYLAKHRLSGRVEVLKVMNKALIGQADSRERFLREIQSAAQLDHKNVVKMYTALERGELLVLVMEYVAGEDLAQVIESRGALPVLNACYYVQQAAEGLQHAFEKGMVHRDIKPQNLILAREGRKHIVKVLDFGLAKATRGEDVNTGLTGTGVLMGTPGYVAPEQSLDAATADIRADIYSLGCTLYHLLAGKPPFSGRSAFEIVQAHHTVEARSLHLVRAEVPEALAGVVGKMMAKDVTQRYQSPMEVVRALEPFVKGVLKPLPSPPVPPKRGPRVATPPPIRDTMIEGDATIARALKTVGAKGSRKWLAVSLAIVLLLAGLLGLIIGFSLKSHLPSADVAAPTSSPDGPFSRPSVTNSIGIKLAIVKPGVFLMGSPLNEVDRSDNEHQHEVEIPQPFYVGIYEVTQEQYEHVMRTSENPRPSWFSPMGGGKDKVNGMDTRKFPVENVSWKDAVEFCRRLSEMPEEKANERTYRLPTEAEWEYVCRGGSFIKHPSPPFYFGNSLSSTQANFDGKFPYGGAAKGAYLKRTTKVGSYPPNPLGLYDLHGNVREWCADWHDAKYYKQSIRQNPQGPENGGYRVLRGGSWGDGFCRSAYRGYNAPGECNICFGFRVVLASTTRT